MRLLLVDKSAYVRGPIAVGEDDELCLCAVTRLELLYSARDAEGYKQLEGDLAAQRQLSARGQHRVSLPDLLIAACAQQHGADVLHVDRHYDVLADVLAFTPIRAATNRS